MRLLRHCGGGAARNPVGGGVCDSAAPSRSRRDYAVIYCARSQVNRIIPQLITRSSTIVQTALDGARGRLKERPRQAFTPSLYVTKLVPVFAPQAPLKLPETPKDVSAGSRTLLRRAAKSPLDSWGGFTLVFVGCGLLCLLPALPQQKNRAKLSPRALALRTSAAGKVATSERPFRTWVPRARHQNPPEAAPLTV